MNEPYPPGSDAQPDSPHSIAQAISDVSERASLLVREEIELAKAELSEKTSKLVKGAVVGAAAGVFLVMALIFVLVGGAWLIYFYLPVGDFAYFWGFFAMAVILVVLGVIAGLIAARAVKRGTPPVPTMAIEEARMIRDTVSPSAGPPGGAPGQLYGAMGQPQGGPGQPQGTSGQPPTAPGQPQEGPGQPQDGPGQPPHTGSEG